MLVMPKRGEAELPGRRNSTPREESRFYCVLAKPFTAISFRLAINLNSLAVGGFAPVGPKPDGCELLRFVQVEA